MNQLEIKENLLSGRLSGNDALELLSQSSKAWQTKEWKQRRAEKIGHACETCGSTNPPLVLQHKWHPPKVQAVFDEIQKEHNISEWMKNNLPPINLDNLPHNTNVCPKCKSEAVRFKQDKNYWICKSNKQGVVCNHICDEPEKSVSWQDRYRVKYETERNAVAQFNTLFDIARKVALRSIEYHERYISMLDEDIKTLCKKCAFLEDKVFVQLKRT